MCKGEEKKHWQFSFDLINERLEKVYSMSNPENAYHDIRRYFFSHGFADDEQKQGSCYFSLEPMTFTGADIIIRDMFHKLLWMSECIRKDAL